MKAIWRERHTTVIVRQGHYAHEAQLVYAYPPADVTVNRIGDLLDRARSGYNFSSAEVGPPSSPE
jgi:hypothetical protein